MRASHILLLFEKVRPRGRAFFYLSGVGLCFALGAVGCALKPPIKEYALARSAVEAAKAQSAARYASAPWFEAEHTYEKAEQLYEEREYDKAKTLFLRAKTFAEKAENAARYEKNQNGDVDL